MNFFLPDIHNLLVDMRLKVADHPNAYVMEVKIGDVWGSICPYSSYEEQTGKVTCQMYGYSDGMFISGPSTTSSGTQWEAALNCSSNETTLSKCQLVISQTRDCFLQLQCYNTSE